jgi:hypothetical protein
MFGLDYLDLTNADAGRVDEALSQGKGDRLVGYIPSEKRLAFVLRNFRRLAELNVLELTWMQTYLHASHLNDFPLSAVQNVFDACDRAVLREHFPIREPP